MWLLVGLGCVGLGCGRLKMWLRLALMQGMLGPHNHSPVCWLDMDG